MDYAGTRKPIMPFEALRNNMDIILGKKKINGLDQYKDLRDRIIRVRDDHNLKSYPKPKVFGNDYEEGLFAWTRQTTDLPQLGLLMVPNAYRENVIPSFDKWDKSDLLKLAYGLSVLDMKDIESSDTKVAQIYNKSLGYVTFEQMGRAPTNIGDHQYVAFVVPKNILHKLPSEIFVFRGQSVSPYSMENALRQDGVTYVREPNGSEIVWRR